MEFQGTKGVWTINNKESELETDIYCGEIRIAQAKHYNKGKKDWTSNDPLKAEGKANAQLIATAPELLEMLTKIYNIENGAFTLKSFDAEKLKFEIEAVIKKATEV